jgi:hypothetical protein
MWPTVLPSSLVAHQHKTAPSRPPCANQCATPPLPRLLQLFIGFIVFLLLILNKSLTSP